MTDKLKRLKDLVPGHSRSKQGGRASITITDTGAIQVDADELLASSAAKKQLRALAGLKIASRNGNGNHE